MKGPVRSPPDVGDATEHHLLGRLAQLDLL
jgi:hypothetical protein